VDRQGFEKGQVGVLFRSVYPPNPCENNHLIPNPSLRAGARIVFRPFRIKSGSAAVGRQVTDARYRGASVWYEKSQELPLIGFQL